MGRFDGRVALVSGASSGIGEATARALVQDGAAVLLLAAPRDTDDLQHVTDDLTRRGGRVAAMTSDISEPEAATEAVQAAMSEFGRLDYLVNNAGIVNYVEFFSETPADFDRLMTVNVRGAYWLAHAAAHAMTDDAAIVFTASVSGWLGEEHQVTYNMSKGAVLMAVRSLALELAPYGIRVNGVAPDDLVRPGRRGDPGRGTGVGDMVPAAGRAGDSGDARAQEYLPALASAEVETARICRRALPRDGLPVMGWVPGVGGLYVIAAHAAVTLAPALAELSVAEVSQTTEAAALDGFRPDRFARAGKPVAAGVHPHQPGLLPG